MAQDEWKQAYQALTGHAPAGPVNVAIAVVDTWYYDIRLHDNGHGSAIYLRGAFVDHLLVPKGSGYRPYEAGRVVEVNGEGVDAVLRRIIANAASDPVKGKHG